MGPTEPGALARTALILALCGGLAPGCQPRLDASGEAAVTSGSRPSLEPTPAAGGSGAATGAPAAERLPPPLPVVIVTAGIKGYTEPCGCTLDLVLGGIDRVVAFALDTADAASGSLVLDAGNLLFEHESLDPSIAAQELRKTDVIVAALNAMGTAATVPGPTDLANGLDYYLATIGRTRATILGANLSGSAGLPFAISHLVETVDGLRIAVIGAADPDVFAGSTEVVVSDPAIAVRDTVAALEREPLDATILLFQGDLAAARRTLGDLTGVDFIVIGNAPRETDEVERVGGAVTLEAFDQGRYVGRLRLARAPAADAGDAWVSARAGSGEEVARIERVIAGIRAQLAAMPQLPVDQVPPIVARQHSRIAELELELTAMSGAELDWGAPKTFDWLPVAMEPDLGAHPPITEAMQTYNLALREINMASAEEPIPALPGEASFVGVQVCAECHAPATRHWETTEHSGAMQTLIDRDKQFDRSCVRCHVTGWHQPGGSALGDLRGLGDVQCEQCHGAGSIHAEREDLLAEEAGVRLHMTRETCVECHSPEHSPAFDFETYLPRVLGPMHGGD